MNKADKFAFWYTVLRRTAVISAVFTVLVFIFFSINYIQIKSHDPLNSPVLEKLYQDLDQDVNNEDLREQIRSLDYLARKAYFTQQWQINTGGALLFIGIIILVISIKTMQNLSQKHPEQVKPLQDTWEGRLLVRKWTSLTGVVLIGVTILLAIITKREMEAASFIVEQKAVSAPSTRQVMSNWPAFRGPFGQGKAEKADIPLKWDGESGENILWQADVNKPGFNSPIVWDDKIYFSGADRDGQEVYCYNVDNGDLLWTAQVDNVPGSPADPPRVTEDTGYAAPTMTTDGNYVYALFATGDLICLDMDGNRTWAKNMGVPDNHYGHSSSLLMLKNMLLIQYDHAEEAFVTALNSANGETIWKTPRDMGLSWSSPLLCEIDDHWEFVVNATPDIVSYNAETGEELWRYECLMGEVAPSPTFADGIVYTTNDMSVLAAIKPGDPIEILWEYEDDLPDVCSPLATDDYIFMPASWGTITCLDSKTGELYWLEEVDEGFYSSPILAGDYILMFDRTGVGYIIKPGKEYELIATNPMGQDVVAIPAVHENKIYVRGVDNLYCIGEK